MSYHFTFDLSTLSRALFFEITNYTEKELIPESINDKANELVQKFNIVEKTGLHLEDAIVLIKDLIETHIKNFMLKTQFTHAKKKALFLPHCCRKYMDSNCKAEFITDTSSYICKHCSKDCMASQATVLAKKEGYDVYILPGASCINKIFEKKRYGGIVGVACTDEIKLAMKSVIKLKIPSQAVPLIKNGCAGTILNFENLKSILSNKN